MKFHAYSAFLKEFFTKNLKTKKRHNHHEDLRVPRQ